MVLNTQLLPCKNLFLKLFPTPWRMFQTFLVLISLVIVAWVNDQFGYLQSFQIPHAIQSVVNQMSYFEFNQNFECGNSPFSCTSVTAHKINSLKLNNSVTNSKFYTKNCVISGPAVYLKHMREGIGNQLFLYACSYALARKHNLQLYLQMPDDFFNASLPRLFSTNPSLHHFEIPLHPFNVVNSTWKVISPLGQIDDGEILAGGYDTGMDKILHPIGLCQSETFFFHYKEEILTLFQQKPPLEMSPTMKNWLNLIEDEGSNSVGVQIRQGDVLEVNRVSLAHFKGAMQRISKELDGERLKFFVFIEDVEEIGILKKELLDEQEIVQPSQLHFIFETNDLKYLYLLSRCSHQIISYNGFGWWSAYLNTNPGKIVYAPHFDPEEIKLMFGNASTELISYMKWQYKHAYYPVNWRIVGVETLEQGKT